MAEVGAAYVSILPSAKGFGRKLSAELGSPSDRAGRDAGRRAGEGMRSGIAAPLKAVSGALAGVFAVRAVGGFLSGAISEATEAAKVGAQTAAVLRSTRGEAGLTAGQIGNLATKLSNLAGVDDELVQQGENVLLTFTNVRNAAGKGNDVFNQATGLALDMSKALGTDLQGSVIQLGKALNDPIKGVTALQRVGVSFTEQQKKQIKALVDSGKTLQAQKIVLGEVRKEFGGTAAAVATPAEKMQVVWGNLKEQIGGPLLKAMNGLLSFVQGSLVPGIGKAADAVAPFAKRVVDGFSGILAFVTKGDFTSAFSRAFNLEEDSPVVDKLFDFRDKVIAAAGTIREEFGKIGPKIQAAISGFVPDVTAFASHLASGFAAAAGSVITGVKTGLDTGDWSPLGKSIGAALVKALRGASDALGKIGSAIGDMLGKIDWVSLGVSLGKQAPSLLIGFALGILNFDIGGLLKGLGKHWFDVILAILTFAFAPARVIGKLGEVLARIPFAGRLLKWGVEAFAKFSKRLVGLVGDALGAMGRAFLRGLIGREPALVGGLRGLLKRLEEAIFARLIRWNIAGGRLLQALGQGILRGVEALGGLVRGAFGRIGGFLAGGARAALSRALSAVRAAWAPLRGAVEGPLRGLGSLVSRGFDAVVGAVRGLKTRISGAVKGVWDGLSTGLKGAINAVISLWNRIDFSFGVHVPGWVPGIGGKGWTSGDIFKDIPLLAKGGTAIRAGLSVVGDAGPELLNLPVGAQVIPLSHSSALGPAAAAAGTTIHIDQLVVPAAAGEKAGPAFMRYMAATANRVGARR